MTDCDNEKTDFPEEKVEASGIMALYVANESELHTHTLYPGVPICLRCIVKEGF